MAESPPPRPPRSVVEALGTGEIPGELSAILAGRFWTVRDDGTALTPEKQSVQGIHCFLASGVHIPGLERVALIGVNTDGTVHILHSLLSVLVDLYSTSQRLFACQGELPAEGLPSVADIYHESFAAQCSIRAVP